MADEETKGGPGGHYSGRNKIPTVNQFLEKLDKDKKERDKRVDELKYQQQHQQQSGSSDAKPHQNQDSSASLEAKADQTLVRDPTTERDVVIEDVKKEHVESSKDPQLSVPNANLDKDTPVKTDASQYNNEYAHNQDVTAPPDPVEPGTTSDVPIHGEKTNILFHPTPSISYEPYFASIEKKAWALCIGVLVGIIVIGRLFGGSLLGLIPLSMCIASGIWLAMKEIVRSGREQEWSSEQTRGETATANLLPESVEWMNTFMGIAWGLINPEMFSAVADTLEDVMQASVPKVIQNVRVAEINQGSNPLRILSLRALPHSHMRELSDAVREENKKTKDPQEVAADEEAGDYYNLEASIAYHAKPTGQRAEDKARNMHMNLVFYLGIKGLIGVPLPIFVELQSLVATARFRVHMTPDPPFVKTLSFTLMGVPQVSAGCVPMLERGVNILNLPLISNFVNYAIAAAANMYVAPKNMSLDLRAMLQGDDITKDVSSMGIMWIRIHRAVGLSKQDKRGSEGGGSDPYITLTFSKYGKPMYCTRVITDDLNPVWEECAALLVGPELIKADENLSVELWDSDRHSADDVVGKVELSMQKMIQHPGKMYPQASKLAGMDADSEMPGELHWEVGYFAKPAWRPALRTNGESAPVDENLKDDPRFQEEKGVQNTADDEAVMHTPPDPLWPSGICSVVVHQIVSLELENIKGSDGNRQGKEYEPAKPYGETTDETGSHLPTSYCTILFNDELKYKTRSKAVSSNPIFNAGTEQFVRDWRSAIVTVTVRDMRNRQHDPILGVVPLRLSDLLDKRSQVTRWYPLDGGIGFGRIRISLLFRSVETKLPPNMLGWEVGTFEFTSPRILALNYPQHAAIKLRTGGSVGRVGRSHCHRLNEGDGFYWELNGDGKHGKVDVRLPVKYRYRSPVIFEFHLPSKRKPDAFALVWLQHLIDNEDTPINAPIWRTKNAARLVQNYVTEENVQAKSVPGLEDLKLVGRLQFRGRFKAGMDESHGAFVVDNETRETFETWEACLGEGVRSRVVEKEVPELTQELHEKSLADGREILKASDPSEQRRWVSKEGMDWSGAFGHNPKAYMDTSGRKRREPGQEPPGRDPINPNDDDNEDYDHEGYSDDDDDEGASDDLGIQDGRNMAPSHRARKSTETGATGATGFNSEVTQDTDSQSRSGGGRGEAKKSRTGLSKVFSGDSADTNQQNKRAEERKQRGLMQWKPARNAKFAKDEGVLGLRKLKGKVTGGLEGRKPEPETEV